MSKLEASKAIVAEIIASLEEQGVVAKTLHVSDFRPEYSPDEARLFSSAIAWLYSESVIRLRGDPIPDDSDETLHYNVVLTSFGFRVLEQRFSDSLTLHAQLQEARKGTRDWSSVGDILGGILGGFTKTIGNG